MDQPIIWHNPRCGKSRKTVALVEEQGHTPVVIRYLDSPPDADTLDHVLTLLDMEPRDLMRKKETPYKELHLANEGLSRADLIAAMVANPILIERPVVLFNGKAAIGRPPENVLEILV